MSLLRYTIAVLFLVLYSFASGQDLSINSADRKDARQITLNKSYTFALSPKGFGTLQEFPKNEKRAEIYFKEERHSVWLSTSVPFNGILTFEIKPHSLDDDYDWMLFESPEIKDVIGEIKLLRSNNSRNDRILKGITGVKKGYIDLFEKPGPGKSFSRSVPVKKGQKLALIVDNIYGPGNGFDFVSELKPEVFAERIISGKVTNKIGQPLTAKIVCEDDSTGVLFNQTRSSSDGAFSIRIPADRPLNITASSVGYTFQTFDLEKYTAATQQDFILAPIIDGEKLLLFNIHFSPDKDLIMQSSEPELQRLVDLLKTETGWNVRIIGHTNNNPFADNRYLQKLSFNRAIAVKQYLMKNGIPEKRISCAGLGGKSPIVLTRNYDEGLKNLRVEVVLSR